MTEIGFDDCSNHSDYIVWSYINANKSLYENDIGQHNIIKTDSLDVSSSLDFPMIRERINKSLAGIYIDLSNKIVNYIHDNKQGADNASIGRVFGFDVYFNRKENYQKDRAIACFIQMMIDRGILSKLSKRNGKTRNNIGEGIHTCKII